MKTIFSFIFNGLKKIKKKKCSEEQNNQDTKKKQQFSVKARQRGMRPILIYNISKTKICDILMFDLLFKSLFLCRYHNIDIKSLVYFCCLSEQFLFIKIKSKYSVLKTKSYKVDFRVLFFVGLEATKKSFQCFGSGWKLFCKALAALLVHFSTVHFTVLHNQCILLRFIVAAEQTLLSRLSPSPPPPSRLPTPFTHLLK